MFQVPSCYVHILHLRSIRCIFCLVFSLFFVFPMRSFFIFDETWARTCNENTFFSLSICFTMIYVQKMYRNGIGMNKANISVLNAVTNAVWIKNYSQRSSVEDSPGKIYFFTHTDEPDSFHIRKLHRCNVPKIKFTRGFDTYFLFSFPQFLSLMLLLQLQLQLQLVVTISNSLVSCFLFSVN